MTLIVIAIALICERLLANLRRWREYDWFGRYLQRLQDVSALEAAWQSPWGLLLLLPPLLLVVLIQGALDGGFFTLLGLVFSVAILIFALGPRDLWEEVRALISARESGDIETAERLAADLACFAGRRPRRAVGQSLVRAVVVQGHERIFGTLLWFFLLGPLGAVLYRMASEFPSQLRISNASPELIDVAQRFHGLLAWVPVRIVTFIYGLAGSSNGALTAWRQAQVADHNNWVQHSWSLLAETGRGALLVEPGGDDPGVNQDLNATLHEALGLITRSLIILLAVLAVFTIGGWIA